MKYLLLTISLLAFNANNTQAITFENEETKYIVEQGCEYVNANYCGNNALTNGLDSNQTTLFYMYSDNVGHYFIDPLADVENVIYVGLNDYKVLNDLWIDVDNLHHGQRFVGTFVDNNLYELIGLEEVIFE